MTKKNKYLEKKRNIDMNEKLKDGFIKELTRLLIKTDFYEHQHNVDIYVKKTRIYRDMIKMVKELL